MGAGIERRRFFVAGHRRWVVLGVAVVVIAAVIGIVAFGGGGAKKARLAVARTVSGHVLLSPECKPVKGVTWVDPAAARVVGHEYESYAIRYSCASAARWTRRLTVLHVPVKRGGLSTAIPGPPGFRCEAWPDANDRAYAGACQKGRKVAFGWNWNVQNPRETMVNVNGTFHVVHVNGSDVATVMRPLPRNHYEVKVLNTSAIGFLTGFTWTAPIGWTITGLTSAKGARCRFAPRAAAIVCAGAVTPPGCLCKGDGGTVTLTVAFKPHPRSTVGAQLRITSMKPVPYLIPGTPGELKRQQKARGSV